MKKIFIISCFLTVFLFLNGCNAVSHKSNSSSAGGIVSGVAPGKNT